MTYSEGNSWKVKMEELDRMWYAKISNSAGNEQREMELAVAQLVMDFKRKLNLDGKQTPQQIEEIRRSVHNSLLPDVEACMIYDYIDRKRITAITESITNIPLRKAVLKSANFLFTIQENLPEIPIYIRKQALAQSIELALNGPRISPIHRLLGQ